MLAENTADGKPDNKTILDLLLAGREFRSEEAEALKGLLGKSMPKAASWKEGLLSRQGPAATDQTLLGGTSYDMYAAYRSLSWTKGVDVKFVPSISLKPVVVARAFSATRCGEPTCASRVLQ